MRQAEDGLAWRSGVSRSRAGESFAGTVRSGAEHIIDANADDDEGERHEEPVYSRAGEPAVDLPAQHAAANAARYHDEEHQRRDGGRAAAGKGIQQAGCLRDEDDAERVPRRGFGIHGEKIGEDDQIERAASDAEEGGEKTEKQPDQRAGKAAFNPARSDALFQQRVNERAEQQKEQAGRLCEGSGPGASADALKQELAREAAKGRACAQRQDRGGFKGLLAAADGAEHRV